MFRRTANKPKNYINHIALVLDASYSMGRFRSEVVKVADEQVKYLAQRSKELDQETRVTVYTFSGDTGNRGANEAVQCLFYDKDVLRLPSIAEYYQPDGMTALIDATLKSQEDLAKTAQLYGDHAFLTFVLTDGAENASRARPEDLSDYLQKLPENWTVAVLVPDQTSKFDAKAFGFPSDNIAIWDAKSAEGFQEAGRKIRQATDTYMTNRAVGLRGSRSMFSTGTDAVNRQSVQQAGLTPLPDNAYERLYVYSRMRIDELVKNSSKGAYKRGEAFYQLTKLETIQQHKALALWDRTKKVLYAGDGIRSMIGLDKGLDARVKPDDNPQYDVFVQSKADNRVVLEGNHVVVIPGTK